MPTPTAPPAARSASALACWCAPPSASPAARPPVWFMRQAGRSLPEYRALRAGNAMLEACRTPDLITEITLQPVRRHGVDAAILFSDIVVPLVAIGVGIDIVARRRAGGGPADPHAPPTCDALRPLEPDDVAYVRRRGARAGRASSAPRR